MARPSQRRGSSFQEQLIGRPGNVVSNQSEQRNRLSVLLQEWQDPVGAALVLAQCLRERTHIGQRLYQQFELELFALRYSSSIRPSSAKNSITSLAKRDDTTKTHSQNPCSSSWTDHPEDVLSQAVMQAYTKLSREILLRSSPPDSSNRRNNRIATRNRRQSTTLTSSSHSEDRFSSSLSTTSSCLISPTLPQGSQQKYRMGDFFHAEDEQEQLQFTAVSPSPSSSNTYASKRMDEGLFPPPTTTTTSRTVAKKLPSQPVVIVDDELDNDEFENDMDDEGSGSRTTQDTVTTRKSANQTLALMDFWVHLLEHIQVHAQSRIITPSLLSSSVVALPKRRGRPKQCCPVFSVAPLDNSGSVFPHHDATIMTLPQLMALRLQLQRQLRAPGGVFHPVDNNTVQQHQQNRKFLSTTREGCGEQPDDAPLLCSAIQRRNNNKMNSTTAMLLGQARVYVVQCIADDCIWIKINSGHCSYSSLLGKENSSSRKTINYKTGHSQQQLEFAAVISPECPQGLAFAVCKNNRPVKAPMTKAISAWKESILVTLKNALGSFFSSCPDDNNSSIGTIVFERETSVFFV